LAAETHDSRDTGYCASPLSGRGTSLAIVGAYVLAGELHAAGGDHVRAFALTTYAVSPYEGLLQQHEAPRR
jgi:2-polyprenyl-6-methoxyphenol hydroxylase-like FAD-dependent oxidoreductase